MKNNITIKKTLDIGVLIVIGIVVIGITIYHYKKDSSVSKYRTETTGKIIDFHRKKDFDYSLKYEYSVNGKKYTGSVGTGFFKCEDGTKGCIGKEIRVFYSSKKPKYSQVHLGKYEKHKTTIYLEE